MTPFIIIIPTYNRAATILRAIRSVQKQDYPSWQIIIVDDGSTDNTAELVKPIVNERIMYLSRPNGGVGAARNTGITYAIEQHRTGNPYLVFLDSDDELAPNALKMMHETVTNLPEQAYFQFGTQATDGRTMFTMREPINLLTVDQVIAGKIVHGEMLPCVQLRLFENHAYRFDESVSGGEALLWWNITRDMPPTAYVREIARIYHFDADNSIIRAPLTLKRVDNMWRLNQKTIDAFGEIYRRVNRPELAAMYYANARAAALLKQYRGALNNLSRAMALQPFDIKRLLLCLISFVDPTLALNNWLIRHFYQ